MLIYEPCGSIAGEDGAPRRTPGIRPSLVGRRLGVLDNGKPNAGVVLGAIAQTLVGRHGAVAGLVTGKGPGANAATAARPEVLARLGDEVDVTLVGSAD